MAGKIKLYGPSGYTEIAADVNADDNVLTLPSSGTLATQEFVGQSIDTSTGYRYVQSIYYTSNGTFVKATYPWLRAVRVRVQGAGGGGGGAWGGSGSAIGSGGSGIIIVRYLI
jgi:hypothetical protein